MRTPARWSVLACLATLALGDTAAAQPTMKEPAGALPDDVRQSIRSAFFEEIDLLGFAAWSPRSAAEARTRMEDVAREFPTVAAVHAALADACTTAGDMAGAEHAHQEAVSFSSSAPWTIEALARFYALRNQPRQELGALDQLARVLSRRASHGEERESLRRVYQRARDLTEAHALPGAAPAAYAHRIIELYPEDPAYLRSYIDELLAAHRGKQVLAEIARYRKAFPREARTFARVEASLAEERRKPDEAEAVYQRLFQRDPVLQTSGDAAGIYRDYFDLLKRLGRERERRRDLLAKARVGAIAHADLAALVHYQLYRNESKEARRILDEAVTRPAEADELLLRARLYRLLHADAAAVPLAYEALRRARTPTERERALSAIGELLLDARVERTVLTPLGALAGFRLRHLTSGPSIAGALASLLFQQRGVRPGEDLDRVADLRLNGVRASAILAELRRLAPRSPDTAELHAALVEFAQAYGDNRAVVAWADEFTRAFAKDARALSIARAGCRARAHLEPKAGGACLRLLLDEARRTGKHDEYARTLDVLLEIWESARAQTEMVRFFWSEIAKHPDDAWLYERFLAQLERHNLFDEKLKVYQEGVRRFATSSWHDRLARWVLRRRGAQAFRDLTRSLWAEFDDDTAAAYLEGLVRYDHAKANADASRFFETMHLEALRRFPHDLRFVRRLLDFYDHFADFADKADALVARYATADGELLERWLRRRAARGRLGDDVAKLTAGKSEAERLLLASSLVFLSQQEKALPVIEHLVEDFPADLALGRRQAKLLRSLGRPTTAQGAADAARALDRLVALYPGDREVLTEAGDAWVEAGRLDEAATRFERVVQLRPGDMEAYLQLASIYWDYFQYDKAADVIRRARARSGDAIKFAGKLAAIHESEKDYARAIQEYVRLAVSQERLDIVVERLSQDVASGRCEGCRENDGAPTDGADKDYARQRLLTLAERKGLASSVEQSWRRAVRRGDGRAVLAYASYLAHGERPAERRRLLIDQAKQAVDPRLLERIADLARQGERDDEVLIAALKRQAVLGKEAAAYVFPLSEALVDAGRGEDAEDELRRLIAKLDIGGLEDADDNLAARRMLAELLWKTEHFEDAIATHVDSLARASGTQADEIALQLVDWRRQRRAFAEAEATARQLVAQHPGVPRFVISLEQVLWAADRRADALRLLDEQARLIRDLAIDPTTKQHHAAALRRRAVDRLADEGRFAEALQQWLEIVRASPSDEEELAALYRFAIDHDGVAGIREAFVKMAAKSFRDVRWPLVLARIADLEGDLLAAAEHLAAALAIAPERTDLWQRRAEVLARAGRPLESAVAWHRLWELSDHQLRFAAAEARMLARGGRIAEALALLRGLTQGGSSVATPDRWMEVAAMLEAAGQIQEAWRFADEALARVEQEPASHPIGRDGLIIYGRLAVRSRHALAALDRLGRLTAQTRELGETEGTADAWRVRELAVRLDEARDTLSSFVGEYALDADARAFAAALLAQATAAGKNVQQVLRIAAWAQAAGLRDSERTILRQAFSPSRVDLLDALEQAHLDAQIVELLETEAGDHVGLLRRLADAYRSLGRTAGEESALQRLLAVVAKTQQVPRYDRRDEDVRRLLQLLAARGDATGMVDLAQRFPAAAPQIADFLFAHGFPDHGLRVIEQLGQRRPAWLQAKLAEALLVVGDRGIRARVALGRLLSFSASLAPIGALLGRRPHEEQVIGRRWYRYAMHYAEASRQVGERADALRFLAAAVEDRPRDPAAFVEQADGLTRLGETTRAVGAYERALTISPRLAKAFDHMARAQLAAGDKNAALATWSRIVAGRERDDAAHRTRFDLLLAAGLAADASALYGPYLAQRWSKRAAALNLADVRALAQAFTAHGAGSEWESYLRRLLDQVSWRDIALLGAMSGHGGQEALLDRPAREPYLRMGLLRAAPRERHVWLAELSRWGLEEGHFDATLDATSQQIKEAKQATREPTPAIRIARARALIGKGERSRAVDELTAWTRTRGCDAITQVADFFTEIGAGPEWELRLEARRQQAARPDHGAIDEVALGEALWHVGKKDEAGAVLRRAVTRTVDDHDIYRLAAEVAERGALYRVARDLRRALAALEPLDGENRLALARDEWHLQAPDRALELVTPLLVDATARAATRRAASDLLGEMHAAKVKGVAKAIDRVAGDNVEEAIELARAALEGDPRRLARHLDELSTPRTAVGRLADEAARRGDHASALAYYQRLRAWGDVDDDHAFREALEAQALARTPAVLRALSDIPERPWEPSPFASRRGREPAHWRSSIEQRTKAIAALGSPLALPALRAAAEAAARLGRRGEHAYFSALVARLDANEATRRSAAQAYAEMEAERDQEGRRFVTERLDDLSVVDRWLTLAEGGRR